MWNSGLLDATSLLARLQCLPAALMPPAPRGANTAWPYRNAAANGQDGGMTARTGPELAYMRVLATVAGRNLGDALAGVYAGGSWAVGGYLPVEATSTSHSS